METLITETLPNWFGCPKRTKTFKTISLRIKMKRARVVTHNTLGWRGLCELAAVRKMSAQPGWREVVWACGSAFMEQEKQIQIKSYSESEVQMKSSTVMKWKPLLCGINYRLNVIDHVMHFLCNDWARNDLLSTLLTWFCIWLNYQSLGSVQK